MMLFTCTVLTSYSRLGTLLYHRGNVDLIRLQQRYLHKLSRIASNPPPELASLVCTVGWARQIDTTPKFRDALRGKR